MQDEEKGTDLVPANETLPTVETAAHTVAAREKAGIEARFTMAMHRPRDFDTARERILAACRRPRFAENVQYAKPIGGNKKVHGLSIRFAEEAMRSWGNISITAIAVFDDAERRIYRVTGIDLETNATQEQDIVVEKFVERKNPRQGDEILGKRTNSYGETVYKKAATEDEILVKANAAIAKARRNLILMLIPSDIREEAEETALDTVRNRDAEDPEGERKRILDGFYRLGVTAAQVKDVIGKPLEQVNPAELQLLRTIFIAVRDGESTWTQIEEDEGLSRMRDAAADKPSGDKPNGKAKRGTAGLKNAIKPPPNTEAADHAREQAHEEGSPPREPGEMTDEQIAAEDKRIAAKDEAAEKK